MRTMKLSIERKQGNVAARQLREVVTTLAISAIALRGAGQVSVTTQHNDIGRTGQNTSETILTPTGVSATTFGKLFTQVVDGVIYAQPLYLQNVTIPTKSTHNVVFIATENDSVYALDADGNGGVSGVPLWVANLATTAHGALPGSTSVPSVEIGEDIAPVIGITGTPVIDPVAGVLYVVSFTKEKSSYVLRLHALKTTSGQEERGSPVIIQATASGTGNGSSNGVLTFDPKWENQRPGLLLLDGVVYIGFAAHGDAGPWHGWLLAYDAISLHQISAYCASPGGVGGGFWMSGAGLAADVDDAAAYPKGRIFAVTGNGDFNATSAAQAGADFGDSVIKLSLQSNVLKVGDSFTPSEQSYLDASDGDLGSGGALIIPDADSTNHLLLQSGKEGKIYLLNRENLGSYHSSDTVVQELANGTSSSAWGAGMWGLPAYWNKTVYFGGRNAPLQSFSLTSGLLSTTPVSQTTEVLNPGPIPSISANGKTNGIVWLLEPNNPPAPGAVLEAYNATNLQSRLYSSQTNAARDQIGQGIRFSVPMIANGKVYAASQTTALSTGAVYGQLNVFGLLSGVTTAAAPVFTPGSKSFTPPLSVTITDATTGAAIYYTTDGSTPSAASPRYSSPLTVNANQTIAAIASVAGSLQSLATSAIYTSTTEVPDPTISPSSNIYANSVAVTIKDSLSTASIYYTTDGSTPNAKSTPYRGSFPLTAADTSTVTLKVIALATGLTPSNVVSRVYGITVEGTSIDCSAGFGVSPCVMDVNGTANQDNDVRLELTSGGFNQAGSAFFPTPVQITSFSSEFRFQLSNAVADGFTFTLQGIGPTQLGGAGPGLGYAGIQDSVALKFDFSNDAGEGSDSTGVFVNGATPTVPSVKLSGTGIDFASDDPFDVQLDYTGNTLDVTITDVVTNAQWATAFDVDIQAAVAGQTAYAGFTGGTTANGTASQKVLTWTYQAGTPSSAVTAAPVFSLAAGTYTATQALTLTDATSGAKIYYTTDGTNPSTASKLYSAPISISTTQTIEAIAVTAGDLVSSPIARTYTIHN